MRWRQSTLPTVSYEHLCDACVARPECLDTLARRTSSKLPAYCNLESRSRSGEVGDPAGVETSGRRPPDPLPERRRGQGWILAEGIWPLDNLNPVWDAGNASIPIRWVGSRRLVALARDPWRRLGIKEVVITIPAPRFDAPGFSDPSAIFFMVVAFIFFVGAVWSAFVAKRPPLLLRGGLALILLGLCVSMSYEAAAVWQHATTDCGNTCRQTISQIANGAFNDHPYPWGAIYLTIMLIGGLLTMHFTRLVQKPRQAEWGLLAAAVLFLTNGALIAFWFKWLP